MFHFIRLFVTFIYCKYFTDNDQHLQTHEDDLSHQINSFRHNRPLNTSLQRNQLSIVPRCTVPRLPNNLFSLVERVVETKVPLGKISFSPNGRTRSALLPLFPDRGRKGEGTLEGSPIRWLNSLYPSLTYKERCNNAGHSIFTMVEGSIACHIKRSQSGASLIHPFPYPPRLSLLDWSITLPPSFFSSFPYPLFSFQSLFLSFSSSFLINRLLLDVNHKNPFLFLFKLRSLVNHPFFLSFDHLINCASFESYKSFSIFFSIIVFP